MLHNFLPPLSYSGKESTNLTKKEHLSEWHFYLPQKEKELFFVLKVVCPQYTFSLPDSDNCYFLGLSKCFPQSDFYLPQAIGQVHSEGRFKSCPGCRNSALPFKKSIKSPIIAIIIIVVVFV